MNLCSDSLTVADHCTIIRSLATNLQDTVDHIRNSTRPTILQLTHHLDFGAMTSHLTKTSRYNFHFYNAPAAMVQTRHCVNISALFTGPGN